MRGRHGSLFSCVPWWQLGQGMRRALLSLCHLSFFWILKFCFKLIFPSFVYFYICLFVCGGVYVIYICILLATPGPHGARHWTDTVCPEATHVGSRAYPPRFAALLVLSMVTWLSSLHNTAEADGPHSSPPQVLAGMGCL